MDDLRTLVGPGFDEILEEGCMEEFGTDDPWLTSRLYDLKYGEEVSTEIDLDRDVPEYLGNK